MMNYVWGGLMIVSVLCGAMTGHMDDVAAGILNGGGHAIELWITMTGMLILWGGLVSIMEQSGLSYKVGKWLSPVIGWIFPELKHQIKAKNAIAMNVAANVLGLGNSATPLGLKAMHELQRINGYGTCATNSMVTFVVLNSVSLQLLPTGMAVIRAKFGSPNPMDVLPAIWFASGIAAVMAIILTTLINGKKRSIL